MQSYESHLNGDLNWALLEGSMHFEGNSAVHRTLRRLSTRLEATFSEYGGVDYAFAGGMGLIIHGCGRSLEAFKAYLATTRSLFLRMIDQDVHDVGCALSAQGRGIVSIL